MRIWIDSTTPKSLRLAAAVMERFPYYEYLHTAREGWGTRGMARLLGLESQILFIGRHRNILPAKAVASLKRQIGLLPTVKTFKPNLLYTHSSLEAPYIAFWLRIPSISTNDSPWSRYLERLTVPLLEQHVIPRYTQKLWRLQPHGFRTSYNGLDEWTWIKPIYHASSWDYSTWWDDWEPRYVLIREPEENSSYFRENLGFSSLSDGFEGEVKYLPRQTDGEFEDSLELLKGAVCTIGIGGTISREAGLLGVPTVNVPWHAFVQRLNSFFEFTGARFALSYPKDLTGWMNTLWNNPIPPRPLLKKKCTDKLESPLDIIEGLLEQMEVLFP